MTGFVQDLLQGLVNFNVIPNDPTPGARTNLIIGILSNGLTLLFVAIIILAIVYAALAGLKYIRSQGEQSKVEEANRALKAVFTGVLVVFLGIIGVILITGVFTNTSSEQVRRAICSFAEAEQVDACVANTAR